MILKQKNIQLLQTYIKKQKVRDYLLIILDLENNKLVYLEYHSELFKN